MKAFFQDIFAYTENCNIKVIELLRENPETYTDRKSLLMSHTLNAHHVWNCRIKSDVSKYSIWQNLDLVNLKTINKENFEISLKLLLEKDLNVAIEYKNSKGESFTNTLSEIFFHIINHSTYHRGQTISLLKSEGIEPISTDYIFYKR